MFYTQEYLIMNNPRLHFEFLVKIFGHFPRIIQPLKVTFRLSKIKKHNFKISTYLCVGIEFVGHRNIKQFNSYMKGMKTTIHVTIRIISNDILRFAWCNKNRKTYLVEKSRINVFKTFYATLTRYDIYKSFPNNDAMIWKEASLIIKQNTFIILFLLNEMILSCDLM